MYKFVFLLALAACAVANPIDSSNIKDKYKKASAEKQNAVNKILEESEDKAQVVPITQIIVIDPSSISNLTPQGNNKKHGWLHKHFNKNKVPNFPNFPSFPSFPTFPTFPAFPTFPTFQWPNFEKPKWQNIWNHKNKKSTTTTTTTAPETEKTTTAAPESSEEDDNVKSPVFSQQLKDYLEHCKLLNFLSNNKDKKSQ